MLYKNHKSTISAVAHWIKIGARILKNETAVKRDLRLEKVGRS
jgi:hypothetical protein